MKMKKVKKFSTSILGVWKPWSNTRVIVWYITHNSPIPHKLKNRWGWVMNKERRTGSLRYSRVPPTSRVFRSGDIKPLHTSWISPQNVSAMFDNHTIVLFWLYNKQTFRTFSLRDLRSSVRKGS